MRRTQPAGFAASRSRARHYPMLTTDQKTVDARGGQGRVEIEPACSGIEGAALIFGFSLLWLWLLRREFRFPRALILPPVSVAVLFFLNGVRIAALIMIGNAGAPDIAVGGILTLRTQISHTTWLWSSACER